MIQHEHTFKQKTIHINQIYNMDQQKMYQTQTHRGEPPTYRSPAKKFPSRFPVDSKIGAPRNTAPTPQSKTWARIWATVDGGSDQETPMDQIWVIFPRST